MNLNDPAQKEARKFQKQPALTLSVFALRRTAQKVDLTAEAAVNRFAERVSSHLTL